MNLLRHDGTIETFDCNVVYISNGIRYVAHNWSIFCPDADIERHYFKVDDGYLFHLSPFTQKEADEKHSDPDFVCFMVKFVALQSAEEQRNYRELIERVKQRREKGYKRF